MGGSTSGAKDTGASDNSFANGVLPQESALEYEGIYYKYQFETGEEKIKLFYPQITPFVSEDPISKRTDHFLVVGINSCLDGDGLKRHGGRPNLNFIVCLDTSYSMDATFQNETKLQIMFQTFVSALLPQLHNKDRLAIVEVWDSSSVLLPLQTVGDINLATLKEKIFSLKSRGGTSLWRGVQTASEIIDDISKKFSAEENAGYENRMFMLTDALPTDSDEDGKKLYQILKRNSERDAYTTVVGFGIDFNADLTKQLGDIPGVNWFSVGTVSDFKQNMDQNFSFLVTTAFKDAVITLPDSKLQIERVFGSPGNEFPEPGILLKMNLASPSYKENKDLTLGGVIVVKLKPLHENITEPLTFGISYKDGKNVAYTDSVTVVFSENLKNTSAPVAAKAVLLTRFISLMKNYIRDMRRFKLKTLGDSSAVFSASMNQETGIVTPSALTEDEQKFEEKIDLELVPEPYFEIFKQFQSYYEDQVGELEDTKLLDELKTIQTIIDVHQNALTQNINETAAPSRIKIPPEIREKKINQQVEELKGTFGKLSKPVPLPNSVEVCFLMDCTGSMGNWITACKNQIKDIVNVISRNFPNITLKISFIGYHDIDDDPRFEILPFTNDADVVKNFIELNASARGGGDVPEDICGGMRKTLDLPWSAEKRIVILIADAPCHGDIFHHTSDKYPDGDPTGLEPEVLLSEMLEKDIFLFFAEITPETDKMITIWRKYYNNNSYGKSLWTFKITEQKDFLPNITDVIASVINLKK